jgi:hypothetical protein
VRVQVVITPHPLNVETEMTLGEFKELLTRVGLIKTKQLKKEYATMPDLISGTFSTLYGPLVPRPSVPSA